ncbi:DUF4426 domain-containing protein [Woeseia oceani]|uniref:DUF4426 domain-containing protein n=1 Tax=Woeseia oceani TaxID=1548547 RepID=UPI0009F1758E|nr:DUF4426 domain-containing protein [Woeseia oceani]
MIPRTLLFASFLSLFLSGCGGPGDSATVPQAQPAEASSVTVNGYSVHFSAQSTDQLPTEVARQYNIVRSKNRAMLNVSIISEATGESGTGSVEVKTVNLTGQLKTVTMRKIQEQDAVYYIGEIPVANSETLVFDITITPDNSDEPIEVRFKRQFYTN